jgi:hypothetical protein
MFKRTDKAADQQSGGNYMQQLDEWTQDNVFTPLSEAWEQWNDESIPKADAEQFAEDAMEAVKKAIREKVLESYHNGLRAQQRPSGAGKKPPYAKR